MKAIRLLAENIGILLRERGNSQHDLAQWCRHSDVWLSNFLAGNREIKLTDLDRIGDFFGKSTYELFIPGRSIATERRSGIDRRSGKERRIGPAHRMMLDAGSNIDDARQRLRGAGADDGRLVSRRQAAAVRAIITDTERRLAALLAETPKSGRQAARTRQAQSATRSRRRTAGGPDSEKAS